MAIKPPFHGVGCDCSVCWAKHYCDALLLFPDPRSAPPFPVNYTDNQVAPLPDCNMSTDTELSGRKA